MMQLGSHKKGPKTISMQDIHRKRLIHVFIEKIAAARKW